MTGQSNAAAERSAHVERRAATKPGADFLAEVRPGVWQLKALAEAEREVERLRAALLKAEMEAEIADIEEVGRLVAIGRREGIKQIVEMFDRRYPYDDIAAEARALLTEGGR